MSSGGREIAFFLQEGFEIGGPPRIVVPLSVGQDLNWDMLPNPLYPRSAISRSAFNDLLLRLGEPQRDGAGTYILQNLQIAGQQVPDQPVRVQPTVARLKVDGILGLDFFQQFHRVTWYPETSRMVLVLP